MASNEELLMMKYKEQKTQARQHETHRATVTNLVILIAGGALSIVGFQTITVIHFVIGLFILFLGVFGAILSKKHYERFKYHTLWAHEYDKKLLKIFKESEIEDFKKKKLKHEKEFGWISKTRANKLWTGIHLLIALLGLLIIIITTIKVLKII
ncbi:hypothetical protein JW960_25405 [candidate division KSB1 bacterium]|nr:hypothetical protein [candidate division KSB1 bacterium]